MSASTNPPADAELLRLLDDHEVRVENHALMVSDSGTSPGDRRAARLARDDTRAALLAYIASHYSRRWSSYPPHLRMPELYAELPEESPDPPIVTGPLVRRKVTIRLAPAQPSGSSPCHLATRGSRR